ncbi:MAG: shikimate dehydrogenase [Candidatus Saganbacteria bacterium]|nr:shikimate dehydrogenase [Candidatus Saganbacteria bacterium]
MKYLYLIGNPVGHSISPQMQNAALKYLGLDCNYEAMLVHDEKDLAEKISKFRLGNVLGFNVTVPFKEAASKYIDSTDAASTIIGAVNTVKNRNGKLSGCNTDSIGFIDSLENDAKIDPSGKNAVILGAGGACRALVFGLYFKKAAKVSVFDIDRQKAEKLIKDMSKYFGSLQLIKDSAELSRVITAADILVNASPVGMYPKVNACPVGDDFPFHKDLFVYDLVYNPAETKLVKLARSKGAKAITGLGMLVRQGAASLEVWTGKGAPVEIMWAAAKKALGL